MTRPICRTRSCWRSLSRWRPSPGHDAAPTTGGPARTRAGRAAGQKHCGKPSREEGPRERRDHSGRFSGGAQGARSLSVDRMDHATLDEMAVLGRKRAQKRTPPRQLHGWAVLAVREAATNGRTVEATPEPDNSCHAEILLSIVGDEVRDQQKGHATELAARSRWLGLP